jgi:glutamine amidotransferase
MQAVIIDYGLGNLGSIQRAVSECCNGSVSISHIPEEIEAADKLILPGVGAFADGMKNLREKCLDQVIRHQTVHEHIPLLGICLGMQLLATHGYEGGKNQGLNIIPGEVQKLNPTTSSERIPHIGWNEVCFNKKNLLFENIINGSDFYFVHSYHFLPANQDDVIGITPYCNSFVSALNHDLIWGVQFHPEKSSILGFNVLKNFLGNPG